MEGLDVEVVEGCDGGGMLPHEDLELRALTPRGPKVEEEDEEDKVRAAVAAFMVRADEGVVIGHIRRDPSITLWGWVV